MIFGRVKPLDAILATAEKKSLHRTLGAFQLTMLGIGGVIGTGIFVLTSEATQKAGPSMILSFMIAAFVCAVAALCYSELASMVPVAGSAYTYTYAVVGELLAWMVGWALILEYAVGASAVSVGWSGYVVGQMKGWLGIDLPPEFTSGPFAGGIVNIPAVVISLATTWLLMIGTSESARVNAILVAIKIVALSVFVVLALPVMHAQNFRPFMPLGAVGTFGAAASIFFAYVGFDSVSTAAEETRDPQRNVPIGLIASLAICTLFYIVVAAGAIGSPLGGQPVRDAAGVALSPGSVELAQRCQAIVAGGALEPLPCSREALAHVLRIIGYPAIGNVIGLAATLALPSVILLMMFGQTRVFYAMARDGLLPNRLAAVHTRWRTPYVVTAVTGVAVACASAFLPVGKLADYSNSGTLFAFTMVAVSVMVLRRTDPTRHRPFRTPAVWLIAPLSIAGCLVLYFSLPTIAILVLPCWAAVGLLIYFGYSRRRSHVGRGILDGDEEAAH